MNLLLDTHVFLWAIGNPDRLSPKAQAALQNDSNKLILSCVSLWEISLKVQAGKLELPATPEYFETHCSRLGILRILAIQPAHIYRLQLLPPVHFDPFDRLLVAQAQVEDLRLLTGDRVMKKYLPDLIW
jgi:PIN domain nuclease of toxin-antitoxin system